MGSFSIWHWAIVLIIFAVPLIVVIWGKPTGQNRFGAQPEPVDFVQAVQIYFRKYASFSGRASRSEFWFSMLFILGATIVSSMLDDSGTLHGFLSLLTFIPSTAIAARRLHDINRSGWWQLLSLCGPIGWIILFVWYVTKSDGGEYIAAPDGKSSMSAVTLSNVETIERLSKLKESGAITEQEFIDQKKLLLKN